MKKNLNNEILQSKKQQQDLNISAIEFTSIGIACHAFCLIDDAGVLKVLSNMGGFKEDQIYQFNNPHLLKAALVTLCGAKVLSLKDQTYFLTNLGNELTKNIGLLSLPLNGYRKLFCKQSELLKNPSKMKSKDIDFAAVALASIDFGANDLNPIIMDIFKTLNPQGTICDLGCGTGEKLISICNATNSPGLGIEKSAHVINNIKNSYKTTLNIEFIQDDITTLKDIWEDVDIAMMSFVCHDINSSSECIKILQSYQLSFPRMRCLIVIDIVSPSEKMPTIMPGFDYVHGLQGMSPRNYEQSIETFEKACYTIVQEISVPNMPNTFIWILKPNKNL